MEEYVARFKKSSDSGIIWQTVSDHNHNVSEHCGEELKHFGMQKSGFFEGIGHDFKTTDAFKEYLEKISKGIDVKRGSVIHTFQFPRYLLQHGYKECADFFEKTAYEILAMSVSSHHGLLDMLKYNNKEFELYNRMTREEGVFYEEAIKNFFDECIREEDFLKLKDEAVNELKEIIKKIYGYCKIKNEGKADKNVFFIQLSFLLRLHISALVDADRCDASEFENGCGKKKERTTKKQWEEMLEKLDRYVYSLPVKYKVDETRTEFYRDCVNASDRLNGALLLEGPTGIGKLFASMRVAFKKAAESGCGRIIVACPKLSILKQNASIIREVLGVNVIENYADVVYEDGQWERTKDLNDPWSGPVVFTTFPKVFDAIFGSRMTDVRRFYSICDSVLVFDESHEIPLYMLGIYNEFVRFMINTCRTSVIMSTATPENTTNAAGWYPLEWRRIVDPSKYRDFRKQPFVWLGSMDTASIAEKAVKETVEKNSCLVICNTKEEVNKIVRKASEISGSDCIKIIGLTRNMCQQEIDDTIDLMKSSLENGHKLLVAATKIIQSGMNLSFASLITMLSGIKDILQAAGRKSRNGENDYPVYIVKNKDTDLRYLPEVYKESGILENIITIFQKNGKDIMGNDMVDAFNSRLIEETVDIQLYPVDLCRHGYNIKSTLYDLLGLNIKSGGLKRNGYILKCAMNTAGECFSLYKDEEKISILVRYGDGNSIIEKIKNAVAENNMHCLQHLLAEAQKYTVQVYRNQFDKLCKENKLEIVDDGIFILKNIVNM